MFKLDIDTPEELINNMVWNEGMENEKNIDYIKNNFDEIIESEVESLEELVNNSQNSIKMLKIIRDNQGEMFIQNDDGDDLGVIGYYTEVNL
jgi:hypothetical protein